MNAWLWNAWGQVWPNLVADALWVPVAWAYHRWQKAYRAELHTEVTTAVADLREAWENLHKHQG